MNYQIVEWVLGGVTIVFLVFILVLFWLLKRSRERFEDYYDRYQNANAMCDGMKFELTERDKTIAEENKFTVTFVDQEQVDAVLIILAGKFRLACSRQIALQQRPFEQIEISLHEMKKTLADMTAEVLATKEDFWQAHAAAKLRGFEVRESSQDYLSDADPKVAA